MKKDGKKDLSETKEALHNLASDTNRELVFLYSFGLNTSAEITSGWLTKALLQKDFDIKNPTELIYFFALKHGKGREWVYKKIDDINEICVAYHEEDCNFLKASRLIENDTDFAKADILEKLKINDEDGLDQYLYEMKERAIQHSGRTCSAIFERLLNEVSLDRLRNLVQLSECPYDTCDPTNDIIEVIEIKNTKRTKLLRFLKDTISSINVNESNMKLPSKDVAIRLFSGVRWTKNTLDKKINLNPSGAPTNRKDLLIALFLNIIVPYMDNKNAGSESFDLRGDVYEFLDEIDIYLNDANMHGFYERSPFDIFLLLCLYQPNPLSYFLCTWALADPETIVG